MKNEDFWGAAVPATDSDRVEILAAMRLLQKFGLGVFRPHKHVNGRMLDLGEGEVSVEEGGVVRCAATSELPEKLVGVGWRMVGDRIELCAGCCVGSDEGPP